MDNFEKITRVIIHLRALPTVHSVVVADRSGYLVTAVDDDQPIESAATTAEAGHLISCLDTHPSLGPNHYITVTAAPYNFIAVDRNDYLLGIMVDNHALASDIVDEIKRFDTA